MGKKSKAKKNNKKSLEYLKENYGVNSYDEFITKIANGKIEGLECEFDNKVFGYGDNTGDYEFRRIAGIKETS